MKKFALHPALSVLAFSILAFSGTSAAADAPQLLNYQGQLSAPDGTPKDGSFTMGFSIYDAASGGMRNRRSPPISSAKQPPDRVHKL